MWWIAIIRDGQGEYPVEVFAHSAAEAKAIAWHDNCRGYVGEVDRVMLDHSRMRTEYHEGEE